MRLRLFCALAILLAAMPRTASAAAFTVNFNVAWDSSSDPAIIGSGVVMSFTVDNGALSPFNQTFDVLDVQRVFIDATPFGGTYASAFTPLWPGNVGGPFPFFTVDGSGQALIDFDASGGYDFLGGFVYYAALFRPNPWLRVNLELNRIEYSDLQARHTGHSDDLEILGPPVYGTATVPHQLVGSVPDATETLPLVAIAFGCLLRVKARGRVGDESVSRALRH